MSVPQRGWRRRPTGSGNRSLRLALRLVASVTVVLAGCELALFLWDGTAPAWVLGLYVFVAVEYLACGLLAWLWRPSNQMGMLLCLGGLSLLVAALENTAVPALVAVGLITAELPVALLVQIVLAFPSGRLDGRLARGLVLGAYAMTLVLRAPQWLFSDPPGGLNGVLQVAHRPGLAHAGMIVQNVADVVVIAMTALVLASRLARSPQSRRRVLAVLYPSGILVVTFVEFAGRVLPTLISISPVTVFVVQISAVAVIPVAFVLGMMRGGFARSGEIDELGAWLGNSDGDRPQLRDALAAALGDDSIALLFWLPEPGRYVDAQGATVALPRPASGRAAVDIELGGHRVAAIDYDARVIADPELVRAAGRVVALALERDRLTAELIANRNALRESRARIVRSADDERRRIVRDLHDGLQGRLVLLAMRAGQLAASPAGTPPNGQVLALQRELQTANDELRDLVQGVMPAMLIERGLYAAAEDLVERLPLPTVLELPEADGELPDAVQSVGYFVVAEALTNAVKHARASELAVRVGREDGWLWFEVRDDGIGGARLTPGSGLRGIADRIDAIGGSLRIESPPGGGTLVAARVPCGS
jgi:signal transduction histidine kinase